MLPFIVVFAIFSLYPILYGRVTGAGRQEVLVDAEDNATTSVSARRRLYLVAGTSLVLVLVADALAPILLRDSYQVVSRMREPLVSPAPVRTPHISSADGERVQPRRETHSEDRNDGNRQPYRPQGVARSYNDSMAAQSMLKATATPTPTVSATASVEPEAASTPPTTVAPDLGNVIGVRANGPVNRGARLLSRQEGADFDVEIVVGSEDPVRITGDAEGELRPKALPNEVGAMNGLTRSPGS